MALINARNIAHDFNEYKAKIVHGCVATLAAWLELFSELKLVTDNLLSIDAAQFHFEVLRTMHESTCSIGILSTSAYF